MSFSPRAFLLYQSPAILWAIFIFILLTIPGESLPTVDFWSFDKLAHAAVFFTQSLLLYIALTRPQPLRWRQFFTPLRVTLVLSIIYAIGSELYQSVLPDREADILDAVANIAGISLFLLVIALWKRRSRSDSCAGPESL